ncbi:MTOR-associated protein MEAK7-like [Diadema antillarum]|uniref:MTOR-associated protein MEAK7-like n=1 Tax=Diadema antillarum TaxID=105358 RepID=UPI003A888404
MGQSESSSKTEAGCGLHGEYQSYRSLFSAEEQDELQAVFDSICQQKGGSSKNNSPSSASTFTESQMQEYLGDRLPGTTVSRLFNQMWLFQGAFSKSSLASISHEAFVVVMAKLLKGTMEETSHMVCCLAAESADRISKANLAEFVGDILHSYEKALRASDKMGGWQVTSDADSIKRFVRYTLHNMEGDDDGILDESQVQSWLEKTVVFYSLLTDLFQVCFHPGKTLTRDTSTASAESYDDTADTVIDDVLHHVPTLPLCGGATKSKVTSLLDLPTLLTLNYHLPHELRREWRFLYSLAVHGSSFSTLLSHIQGKGPSIILIRDTEGRTFGGFASESWRLGPNFVGDTHCFLFTLTPDLGIYETTGHNDHYMYLNIDQQTMPNGLGMGGQFEYFGLWLDQDFGKGHSRARPTCTTYESPRLSGSEDFVIDCLEAWAVGPVPKKKAEDDEEEGGPKSILDKDPEAKALLDLVGKERKSEGLREVEDDATADIPEVHHLPPLS